MTKKNEIVKQGPMSAMSFEEAEKLAIGAYKLSVFGVTQKQAQAIIIMGAELELGLAQSFEFIHVIQGKPTLSPRGALALAHSSGVIDEMEIIEERDAQGNPYSCTVKGRRGILKYETTFTMDDARRAGLVKDGSGWTNYPANMLKWRATGYWLDVVVPDTQGGMKRADEFGATVDEDGSVMIEAEIIEPEESSVITVDTLIEQYGADDVMEAISLFNNGAEMPTSQEDIEAVISIIERDQPTYKDLSQE